MSRVQQTSGPVAPPIKRGSQQHRILEFLGSRDKSVWSTRQDMYSFVGTEKGYAVALGAPTGKHHDGSLEDRGFVVRHGATRFSYQITDAGREALAALNGRDDQAVVKMRRQVNVEIVDLSDKQLEQAIEAGELVFPDEVETGESESSRRSRRGQDALRRLAMRNYRNCCALCDVTDERLLRASHIVPWALAKESRGMLSNVICLCAFHDVLFELGRWSLDDSLEPLVAQESASSILRTLLPSVLKFRAPLAHPPGRTYLKNHRGRHGIA